MALLPFTILVMLSKLLRMNKVKLVPSGSLGGHLALFATFSPPHPATVAAVPCNHGCQMAKAGFLDCICWALWASGL